MHPGLPERQKGKGGRGSFFKGTFNTVSTVITTNIVDIRSNN